MDRLQILQPPLSDSKTAAAILEHYELSQAMVSKTLETAALACQSALRCGELLLEMKERKKGEFLLWCKCYVPAISESTAKNYMRCANLRRELGDKSVDLQSLRQFYQLLGIMPPRGETQRQNGSQILSFWAFTTKIQNWLPQLPEEHKPRVREWWESIGKSQGWI